MSGEDRQAATRRRTRLPRAAEAVAGARTFARESVEAWGLAAPEDLALLTSEVFSNAVEHTTTRDIGMEVWQAGHCVHVEVGDDDPRHPVLVQLDPAAPGGLGLALIDGLAARWGVRDVPGDGKRVWFELELPGTG